MKILIFILTALVSNLVQAHIYSWDDDLDEVYERDIYGKSSEQIKNENREYFKKFIALDVNARELNPTFNSDLNKPKYLTQKNAVETWVAAMSNPVISMASNTKYDPSYGIGFCFGRALFVDFFLTLNGFNQGSIKKVFVVGPMSNNWGWHVATIVQSLDENKKVKWLVIDPIVFKVVDVMEWFKEFEGLSVDGKIKLYISHADKFSKAALKYEEQNYQGYNGYFDDMFLWLKENKVTGKLILDKF